MAVGTEKNNVISGVVSARVFSVHLQHYRLVKPSVQSTDLASVTTFFYEPQTNRALPNRKMLPLRTRNRLHVSYAFVNRDVLYPTAHGSPGHVDLACDTPVSVAGPTQLDRLAYSDFLFLYGPRIHILLRTESQRVKSAASADWATPPGSFGSIPARFSGPVRCSRRARGRGYRGVEGSTRLSRSGWRRRGGGR
jgi:hypothetical protein